MSFEAEKHIWEREVDEEAARLVRNGMPPSAAMRKATENISLKRSGLPPKQNNNAPS